MTSELPAATWDDADELKDRLDAALLELHQANRPVDRDRISPSALEGALFAVALLSPEAVRQAARAALDPEIRGELFRILERVA